MQVLFVRCVRAGVVFVNGSTGMQTCAFPTLLVIPEARRVRVERAVVVGICVCPIQPHMLPTPKYSVPVPRMLAYLRAGFESTPGSCARRITRTTCPEDKFGMSQKEFISDTCK